MVEQITKFKMLLFWIHEWLHFKTQLDNIGLIIFKIILIEELQVYLLLDLEQNVVQIQLILIFLGFVVFWDNIIIRGNTTSILEYGFNEYLRILPLAIHDEISKENNLIAKFVEADISFLFKGHQRTDQIMFAEVIHNDQEHLLLIYLELYHLKVFEFENIENKIEWI